MCSSDLSSVLTTRGTESFGLGGTLYTESDWRSQKAFRLRGETIRYDGHGYSGGQNFLIDNVKVHADPRGTGGGGSVVVTSQMTDLVEGGNGGTMNGLAQLGGSGCSGTGPESSGIRSTNPFKTGDGGFGGGGGVSFFGYDGFTRYSYAVPGGGGFGGGGGSIIEYLDQSMYTGVASSIAWGRNGQSGQHTTFTKTVPSAEATYTIVVGAGGDARKSAVVLTYETKFEGGGGQGIVIIKY